MIWPVPGRPYTAARKRFEHELQVRNYSEELVFDTVGGESVIARRIQKLHNYFQNPVFSILECPRDSGSIIYDYSGQDHNFDVIGFLENSLISAYWQTDDSYRCPNSDPAEYLPAIFFDGVSCIRTVDTFSDTGSFSFLMFFRRSRIDVEECLLYRPNAFSLSISAAGALVFAVDSGLSTDQIVCSKTIGDTMQHFLACRFDATGGTLSAMLDDVITSDSTAIAAINSTPGKITLFRDGDSGTAYAQGYAHSAALTWDALSNSDLAALRDQIEPYGYALTDYNYDDGDGTETGESYALWKKKYGFPYLQYFVNLEFDYSSGYAAKTESTT